MSQLENWLQFAHKLFWHVCIWLALGHLIFYGLWTNLLVRSQNGPKLVTNAWRVWSRTFIIQMNTGNIVLWETQNNIADLDCSKTLVLQETLKTQISTSRGVLCIFGSHTFVPISWTCKKQTWVPHSSTEAEIISLDAGLRMDGIPALTLRDLVIEVFPSEPNNTRESYGKPASNGQVKHA